MGSKRRDARKSGIPAQIRLLLMEADIARVKRKWGQPVDEEPRRRRRRIGELVADYVAQEPGRSVHRAVTLLAEDIGVSARYLTHHYEFHSAMAARPGRLDKLAGENPAWHDIMRRLPKLKGKAGRRRSKRKT